MLAGVVLAGRPVGAAGTTAAAAGRRWGGGPAGGPAGGTAWRRPGGRRAALPGRRRAAVHLFRQLHSTAELIPSVCIPFLIQDNDHYSTVMPHCSAHSVTGCRLLSQSAAPHAHTRRIHVPMLARQPTRKCLLHIRRTVTAPPQTGAQPYSAHTTRMDAQWPNGQQIIPILWPMRCLTTMSTSLIHGLSGSLPACAARPM